MENSEPMNSRESDVSGPVVATLMAGLGKLAGRVVARRIRVRRMASDETLENPNRVVDGFGATVTDAAANDTTLPGSGQATECREPNASILLRCPHCGATRPIKNPEVADLLRAATMIQASIHGVTYDCKQCGKFTVVSSASVD
jgi:predicted RNA-binding Zn-ribbon protein involved in translation (DUF1610 family)